jgi:MurNAc alpha-1-phosphate uridylyltransferase
MILRFGGLGSAMMPKRAIVLAAGLGTRMRPYNGQIPKPLVAVGGKSLIDYGLDRLADAGVERAVVNVHHLADAVERHLASRQVPRIVISDERAGLLGTGGAIAKALPQLGDAPFFLVNSDTLWLDGVKPNFARLAESFDANSMDALLLLAPTAGSIGYEGRGDYAMLSDGRLRRRAEQEVVPFIYAGYSLAGFGCRRADGRLCADAPVRPRRRKRPVAWAAPRRRLDACRHAGGRRRRRSGARGDGIELGIKSDTPYRSLVVPAKAGTHNHRSSNICLDCDYGFPLSRE